MSIFSLGRIFPRNARPIIGGSFDKVHISNGYFHGGGPYIDADDINELTVTDTEFEPWIEIPPNIHRTFRSFLTGTTAVQFFMPPLNYR
jgi:hypothetical protein